MAQHHEIDKIPELKKVEKEIRRLWHDEDSDIEFQELPADYCSDWCGHKVGYSYGQAWALPNHIDKIPLPEHLKILIPDDWQGCGFELHANGSRIRQIYVVM